MIHFHCVSHQHGEYRSRVIIVILLTIIDFSISKKVSLGLHRYLEILIVFFIIYPFIFFQLI